MIQSIQQLVTDCQVGDDLQVHARVANIRRHKQVTFVDLQDFSRRLQVVASEGEAAFETLTKINTGAYLRVHGKLESQDGQEEIHAREVEVLAHAPLAFAPTPWEIDGLDPRHADQILRYPGYYLANPERAAVLKIKTTFVNQLHKYLQQHGFTLVEPPLLTETTLYDDKTAVRALAQDEEVFLSQCATFELEPLSLSMNKVYTIAPSFRNEKTGSKRHLTEYSHAKVELLLADLPELKRIASDMIYQAVKQTVKKSKSELKLLGKEIDLETLNPDNYQEVTYKQALKIIQNHGSTTSFGEGLSHGDEKLLTQHFGDNYVWVDHLPFASESFAFRRKADEPELSMTCDLIAPHGAGEMLGVAEKTTDANELIRNLIQKGKGSDLRRYWQYILLRLQGLPQHGGIGAAPERIIYGLLDLDHIRLTKPWPRYPGRKIGTPQNHELNPWGEPAVQALIDKYNVT